MSRRRRNERVRTPRLEPLEDRRLLANVTVGNHNDVVNGTTTSIAALIATPGADGGATTAAARFALWKANFGNLHMPSTAVNSAASEPTAIHLLLIAGVGCLMWRRRRMPASACAVLAALLIGSGNDLYGAPTVSIVPGGTQASNRLNAEGNWVWKVQIATSNPIPSGSSPLAAELGFKVTSSVLLDANNLSTGTGDDFDTVIPGAPIWGWENPGTGTNGFPEGLQCNCAGGLCTENTPGNDPNTIFAALGSQLYGHPTTADFIEIISKGPSISGSLTSSISWSGVYGIDSNKGRIAELNPSPPPYSIKHDIYAGTVSSTAKAGDANLDNLIDVGDYNTWSSNAGGANTRWHHGDFDDDDAVNSADLNVLLDTAGRPGDFDFSGAVDGTDFLVWQRGVGSIFTQADYDIWQQHFGKTHAVAAIPEPSSTLLSAMALLAAAGVRRRRLRNLPFGLE